jgi:hypothetical protein
MPLVLDSQSKKTDIVSGTSYGDTIKLAPSTCTIGPATSVPNLDGSVRIGREISSMSEILQKLIKNREMQVDDLFYSIIFQAGL